MKRKRLIVIGLSLALLVAGIASAATATRLGNLVVTGNFGVGNTPVITSAITNVATSTEQVFRLSRGIQGADTGMTTAFGFPYMNIGGGEFKASAIQTMGFGYMGSPGAASVKPWMELGAVTTSTAGNGKGDMAFAIRDVTTDTAPTEVFRIKSAGDAQLKLAAGNYLFQTGDYAVRSSDGERVERAYITNNGTTCVAGAQSATWIGSLTRNGAGDCTVTFAASKFSAFPSCVCSVDSAATGDFGCYIWTATGTDVRIVTTVAGAATNKNLEILCVGPK